MTKHIIIFIIVMLLMSACSNQFSNDSLPSVPNSTTLLEPTYAPASVSAQLDNNSVFIEFQSSVLEAKIREILNKPTGVISEQDVLIITELDLDSVEIYSLKDFASFKNLKKLSIGFSKVDSLEGIEGLQNLESLWLRRNNLTDIHLLENLTSLKELDVAENNINDFSPLKNLINLESLGIGDNGNSYTDLSPIKTLIKLKRLYAPWCGVMDISVLCNMTELTYLQLFHNNISDISALSNLTKLEYLELGINKIKDISPLENLRFLEHINLQDNLIPKDVLEKYYKPKTDDYFTAIFNDKIKDDMPEFAFELVAYFNKSMSGYSAEKLTITNTSTGNVLQEISIPELTLFGHTNVSVYDKETVGFELEDLNFDGYKDIRLFDTANGNYRLEWIYLVWNPSKNVFENDTRLNAISLANFDQEKQLIYGMERGSAADHWYFTYEYIDGDLVLIELVSDNFVHFMDGITDAQITEIIPAYEGLPSSNLQYIVKKKLNTSSMEMEIIEEKFMLYISNEWKLIEEYDANSSNGKKLKELVNWEFTSG